MNRQQVSHIIWASCSACLALGAVLLYALLGRSAPYPAGGGIVGYTLGIVSLALAGVAAAYWHRGQRFPRAWQDRGEAALERPTGALGETREKLADLQAEAAQAKEPSVLSLRSAARRIVKAAGLGARYRVIVRRGAEGKPYIRMEPKEPLNALSNWLLGHQYLGGLSLLLAGLHCGFRVQSPIGAAALFLLVLVVVSGLAGAVIYTVVAPRLTALEAALRERQVPDPAQNAAQRARCEAALKVWLYVHTPLTVALLVIAGVHVLAVLYYY